jgi:hypothetical protein
MPDTPNSRKGFDGRLPICGVGSGTGFAGRDPALDPPFGVTRPPLLFDRFDDRFFPATTLTLPIDG